MRFVIVFTFSLLVCKISLCQEIPEISYIKKNYKQTGILTIKRSFKGSSYDFMSTRRVIGGNNSLLKISYDKEVFDQQIQIINSILKSSSIRSDGYKGWISLYGGEKTTLNKEVPLYESYTFIYIAEFLYLAKNNGWIRGNSSLQAWHENTLHFIEKNIWEKWRVRSQKTNRNSNVYFLRNRTHMGSHWAGIARFLNLLTESAKIRQETKEVYKQYDILLRRNLRKVGDRYLWNSTYDNVRDTDAVQARTPKVQDVSHGNHVIAYVVLANELDSNAWSDLDLQFFANTLKYIFDAKTVSFFDNIDRSKAKSFVGWGNFIADGWIRLAKQDNELKNIIQSFSKKKALLKKYNQEFQFMSNMSYYCR